MTFDDYLEKQDHILIRYYNKPFKRVFSLEGIKLKDVFAIAYLKYDTKKGYLVPHREDGPARIEFYKNGNVEREFWAQNNDLYRLDGPAYIMYDKDGNITNMGYYINGVEYTKEDYLSLGYKL